MSIRTTAPIIWLLTATLSVASVTAAEPAEAATVQVGGEANCSGSWVEYYVYRRMTVQREVHLALTKSAGSRYGGWAMTIGVHLPQINRFSSARFLRGAGDDRYLSGNLLERTRFRMRAKMTKSDGTCSVRWAGRLSY